MRKKLNAPALIRIRSHRSKSVPEIPEGHAGCLGSAGKNSLGRPSAYLLRGTFGGVVLTTPHRSGSFGQSVPGVVLRSIGVAELSGMSDMPMTSMGDMHPWSNHMGT